jgi:hypothetical protein
MKRFFGAWLHGAWPLLLAALLVYIPLGGWKLLYGSSGGDDPATRAYGAAYPVPGFAWVVVLNPEGVSTADGHLGFFDSCLIGYRGAVREVTSHHSWYAALSRDTLVEYRAPAERDSVGVLCPDGALFLLPRAELDAFPARTAERSAYESRLAAEVRAALAGTPRSEAQPVRETIRWVEALNPQGLESYGYRIGFLDACGLEEGGMVRALSATSQGMLYTYTPHPALGFRGIGIPCPPDTVFLQHGSARNYF